MLEICGINKLLVYILFANIATNKKMIKDYR